MAWSARDTSVSLNFAFRIAVSKLVSSMVIENIESASTGRKITGFERGGEMMGEIVGDKRKKDRAN
jgi:hypothetical protein